MSRHTVSLVFEGPVASAGEQGLDLGIDRPMARDIFGRLVLPASHVKGRLREALEQAATLAFADLQPDRPNAARRAAAFVAHLFGHAQRPGSIGFGDFVRGDGSEPSEASTISSDDRILVSLPKRSPEAAHYQVAIDRQYGRAHDQALAIREGPGYGRRTQWAGTIELPTGGVAPFSATETAMLLQLGLRWLDSLGTENATGWGWLVDKQWDGKSLPDLNAANLSQVEALFSKDLQGPRSAETPDSGPSATAATKRDESIADAIAASAAPPTHWCDVAIVLHGPLLVTDNPRPDNFRESTPYIPGSVLKRALADVLLATAGRPRNEWIVASAGPQFGALSALASIFDDLHVSHALPLSPEVVGDSLTAATRLLRPLAVPLTALKAKGELPTGDALVNGLGNRWGIHDERQMMAIEWGDGPTWHVDGKTGAPRRLTRTRTAVSRYQRAARDSALFTYLALHPFASENTGEQTARRQVFIARIGFPATDPEKANATAHALKAALGQIGRLGKAIGAGFGHVRLCVLDQNADPAGRDASDPLARLVRDWTDALHQAGKAAIPVVLNTDALLLEPFSVDLTQGQNLLPHYQKAWREIMANVKGPEVELHPAYGCIATHMLRGAWTAAKPPAQPPVVLTRAGSVFLLTCAATDSLKLQSALLRLARTGLEVPAYVQAVENRWRRRDATGPGRFRWCPYRASNGYGEIVLGYSLTDGERHP